MTNNIITMPTPLDVLSERISAAKIRAAKSREDWLQATFDLIAALSEARARYDNDIEFSIWLVKEGHDDIGKDDRAALIAMAGYMNITQIVLSETDRSSWRHIWLQEIKPRVRQVANPPVTTMITSEVTESPVIEPQKEQSEETQAPEIEVVPASLPKFGTKKPALLTRRYKKAQLVLAYILDKQTRACLANILPKRNPGLLWDILLYSIESGAFGEPSAVSIRESGLRLLLPWIPRSIFNRFKFDLKNKSDLEIIRDHLLRIVLENRELLKTNPDQLWTLFAKDRVGRENKIRETMLSERRAVVVAKLPANEQPIIAFGRHLWPVVDGSVPYTFDELCLGCWFGQFMLTGLSQIPNWNLTSQAIHARKMLRFTPQSADGWAQAVAAFFTAYANNPNGECQIPPVPANFRLK